MANNSGLALREYRDNARVNALDLAEYFGWNAASQVTRRELGQIKAEPEWFTDAIKAVDAIVEERQNKYRVSRYIAIEEAAS